MKQLHFALLQITTKEPLDFSKISAFRGFISSYFENELLANRENNRIRYTASLVQYKIINGEAIMVGIGQGAELLKFIQPKLNHLELHGRSIDIEKKIFSQSSPSIGISENFIQYRFATPWIPLNKENFEQYCRLDRVQNIVEQQTLLQRILIGNIIAFSKHFSYEVNSPILVPHLNVTCEVYPFKNVKILGFSGQFTINFTLPPYWGIGRIPSRGFGTVMPL